MCELHARDNEIFNETKRTKQKRDKKNMNNIGLFVFMETTQIDTTIELK